MMIFPRFQTAYICLRKKLPGCLVRYILTNYPFPIKISQLLDFFYPYRYKLFSDEISQYASFLRKWEDPKYFGWADEEVFREYLLETFRKIKNRRCEDQNRRISHMDEMLTKGCKEFNTTLYVVRRDLCMLNYRKQLRGDRNIWVIHKNTIEELNSIRKNYTF